MSTYITLRALDMLAGPNASTEEQMESLRLCVELLRQEDNQQRHQYSNNIGEEEHLHHTPPRPSSRRAAIGANVLTTAMLTPVSFVSSAAEQQDVAAAEEENATSAEFRDDDSPSLSTIESSEQLHHTPPRPSSRRAAIGANVLTTAMLTPVSFVSSAAEHQDVTAAVEENATSAEFRDDVSPSQSSDEASEAEELECCICLEVPSANDVATIDGCDHKFCIDCITEWSETNNVCPLFRTRFTAYESAGGVLQHVPDRRPVTASGINLVRLFNALLDQQLADLRSM